MDNEKLWYSSALVVLFLLVFFFYNFISYQSHHLDASNGSGSISYYSLK